MKYWSANNSAYVGIELTLVDDFIQITTYTYYYISAKIKSERFNKIATYYLLLVFLRQHAVKEKKTFRENRWLHGPTKW